MHAIIPYVFFIYIFLVTWICLYNYETIMNFSKNKAYGFGFISLVIACVAYVGVATLYYLETDECDFAKKIDDANLDLSIFFN